MACNVDYEEVEGTGFPHSFITFPEASHVIPNHFEQSFVAVQDARVVTVDGFNAVFIASKAEPENEQKDEGKGNQCARPHLRCTYGLSR